MWLRPQELSDVFSVGFATLRANLRTSLAIFVLPAVVIGVIMAASVTVGAVSGLFSTLEHSETAPVGAVITLVVACVVLFVTILAASSTAAGANVHVFGQSALGRKTTARQAMSAGLRSMPALVGVGIIVTAGFLLPLGLVIGAVATAFANHADAIGVIACLVLLPLTVVVSVVVMPRLSFASYAVVLETARPIAALRRSWALTRGRFWRTFGTLFLIGTVASVASSIVTTPLQIAMQVLAVGTPHGSTPSGGTVVAILVVGLAVFLVTALLQSLAQSFTTAAIGAMYADARIRDEGLDRRMADATGARHPTPPNAPVTLTPGELEFPRPR